MKPKIGILSLGCPRNIVDSEGILGQLNFKGYKITDMDKADVAIVNTCGFIEDAKKESIDAILDLIDLKRQNKLKKVIVYGCLTQRYAECSDSGSISSASRSKTLKRNYIRDKDDLVKELPEVDAFVGSISLNHNLRRFAITSKHYAYIKICEGCLSHCSFCAIPIIKPKFMSLDIDSILKKVSLLDKDGIYELNIIGQDITGYGLDLYGRLKLTCLLNKIIKKTKNIAWIRLLYLYPNRITDELLDLIRDETRICKYIDLPIQHINERILKLMHRLTTKKDILKLIDKIRKKIPQAAIRTSLIVGFPSETDQEFKELLDFIKDIRFERLGAFIYSREEQTPAYNFKKQIPHKIKIERLNAIMLEQQRVSCAVNQRFQSKIIDVLIDEKEKDGIYLGRSQYDAPEVDGLVYVHSKKILKPGDFVKVRIIDTLEYDLVGEVNK